MSPNENTKPKRFGLLLFPQWELLDMAGPIECLNTMTHMGNDSLELFTISAQPGPISTIASPPNMAGSLFQQQFVATHSLNDALALSPPLDVLIIPGGFGACQYLAPDFKTPNSGLQPYIEFIAAVFPKLQYLFTICNGSGLPAAAGVLDGHKATTNKTGWAMTTKMGPKTHWIAKARWVDSGKVWTTSGVSAGTDGMVAFIAKIWGEEMAEEVCRRTEYIRRKESGDDPFADREGAEDVLPAS